VSSPYRQHVEDALAATAPVPPVTVRVYDRTGRRLGTVGAPRQVGGTLRDHDTSTFRLEVDLDHHLAPALQTPGARVEVDLGAEYHSGGWATANEPTGGPDSTLGVDVMDYEGVVADLLGWPVPPAGLDAQVREQWRMGGPAETVAKELIRANAARQARKVPVFVAPSQGRGTYVLVTARMDRLDEVLLPALEHADLRIVVRPAGPVEARTGLLVDVVPRTVYPMVLTEAAGIVVTSAGRVEGPTATRVVIGGGGEGVERDFRSSVDAAREAEWAREIEVFIDARDARSEVDETRRDLFSAQEAVAREAAELRETAAERRITIAEARAELTATTVIRNEAVSKAEVELVNARAAQDRLSGTSASQADKEAAQAETNRKIEALRQAEKERTDDVAAATKKRDDTIAEQDTRLAAAKAESDAAVDARAVADAAFRATIPAYEEELRVRMRAALAEGAPTASVSVALSETATFRYGRGGLVVGARVNLGLARGVEVVERLRSVEWSWAPDASLTLTPQLGERPPDIEDRLVSTMRTVARAVAAVARSVRQQSTRR
jgi:hypothetical protein